MNVWLRVMASMLAAGLFFLSISFFRRVPDPVFEGRLTSAWADDLLSSDYRTRTEAQLSFQMLGEAAVPQLRVMLRKRNAPWERHLVTITRWVPFLEYRITDADLSRQRAAEMVGLLRGKARAALPDLIGSLAIEPCAPEAERALRRCGEFSLPALEKALQNREATIRRRAAKLLGESRDLPGGTVASLIRLKADSDPEVRRQAAHTLGLARTKDETAAIDQALLDFFSDRQEEVRAAAAEAFGNRAGTRESILAVRRGLTDPAALVRLHSAKALWRLTAESEPVLPVLIALLPLQESWQAAYALADLGELAEPAVPSLVRALGRERVPRPFRTPPSCAFALGKIGPSAIPALREMLGAEDPRVRLNAVLAIGFMTHRGQAAVPDLLPLLEDKDAEVRHATALTLAAIGAESKQVIAGLSACLAAEDIYMRSAAAQVLREIAPDQNWVVEPE